MVQFGFTMYNAVMCPKGANDMANIVDPDQTAPKEQSELGLHCLRGWSAQTLKIFTV